MFGLSMACLPVLLAGRLLAACVKWLFAIAPAGVAALAARAAASEPAALPGWRACAEFLVSPACYTQYTASAAKQAESETMLASSAAAQAASEAVPALQLNSSLQVRPLRRPRLPEHLNSLLDAAVLH